MSIVDKVIDRRLLLKGFLVAGPTLAVAARLDLQPAGATIPGVGTPMYEEHSDFMDEYIQLSQPFLYDLLVEIKPDNRVYFEIPRMEVGQGIMTTIATMMADNLDVPLESMDVALSKADPKFQDSQWTGASNSTRMLWDPVRVVAAKLRAHLTAAAAQQWLLPAATLRTQNGYVIAPDGRKLSYGALTAAAATVVPTDAPRLKKPDEFKLIGQGRTRANTKDIVTGKATYCMDLTEVPGAKPTIPAVWATHGATVKSVDNAAEVMAIPGVIAITPYPGYPEQNIPGGVAITAETFGIAKKAKNALKVTWSAGPMDNLSDKQIDDLLAGIQDKCVAPDLGEGVIDANFRWPYVSHAPMETNTAVAHATADKVEVWSGPQIPITAVRNIAKVLGYAENQVVIHIGPRGGAFGRWLFHDAVFQSAQISKLAGMPVKFMLMREEDIKSGRTRPVSLHHLRATIKGGQVATFEHRMACPEMDLRHGLGDIVSHQVVTYNNNGAGLWFFECAGSGNVPYNFGVKAVTLQQHVLAVPNGAWRVVYSGQVCSANEILVDELARLLGKDEYQFRREYLMEDKQRRVLDMVAHEGQWGRPLPAGVAQGLGFHQEYHSLCAYLMEVDTRGAEPRMTRCTIAVDPGFAINPTGITSNMYSAAHDGFATVFKAGLHIDNGATRESNWNDYKWTRMYDSAPEMSCHIVPNTQAQPGGIGEVGIPAAAAAAANAWARATGKKARNFPINEYGA
ncbi:MAG: xanthine dehydrogenase family protein molybdopterin-binding subunit [Chloroflexi bacterium]|nr:MAG: xanthine dehydrogenase family protein molybdopterin-binding subunit [Chloroflexota bacterium]